MSLAGAFDNRSLRTKIGAAVLAATVSGLLAGAVALVTVHRLNSDAAAAQQQTLVLESSAGAFSKNIEAFSGSVSAAQLYPALAGTISQGMTADKQAISDALNSLEHAFAGDPAGADAVVKARTDWQSFLTFITTGSRPSAQDINQLLQQYNAVYGALTADEKAVQEGATALSQKSIDAARADQTTASWLIAGVIVVGTLLSLLIGFRVASRVRTTVQSVSRLAEGLAEGDLTRTSGVTTNDEVGRMAAALDEAISRLRQDVIQLAGNAGTLEEAARQLADVSSAVDTAASEASTQAGSVAAAADQVSDNLQIVSHGSLEMDSSIRDISRSATEASGVAAQAVEVAAGTTAIVSRLGDSSSEIATVVKVITSIAEQTNLLALNATIEAARAGEAGKGFAVVAGEVKDLAQETAKATEDISRRVETIQADTSGAVTAIGEISAIIERINSIQLTIASAVEEQTATTADINRTLSDAASGAGGIATSINSVSASARRTTESVVRTRQSANELATTAGQLQNLVSRFRY